MKTQANGRKAQATKAPEVVKNGKNGNGKKAQAPKAKATVKEAAEKLLKTTDKPYDEIVAAVKKMFPGANTSTKSVAWYASRLRKAGVKLPERKRTKAA